MLLKARKREKKKKLNLENKNIRCFIMYRRNTAILLIILSTLIMSACSNSRHLPAGESLFKGSRVHIIDRGASHKVRKQLVNDLVGLVRPKPNSKTLGVRIKLTLYDFAGNPRKKKGLRNWLRNKVGEPPVLASSVNLVTNKQLMINHLRNKGFFYATGIDSMKTNKKKKATAAFEIAAGPQYTILKTLFTNDSSRIAHDIDSAYAQQTLLTPGAPYNLDLIKAERNRIDRLLKEKGYYPTCINSETERIKTHLNYVLKYLKEK